MKRAIFSAAVLFSCASMASAVLFTEDDFTGPIGGLDEANTGSGWGTNGSGTNWQVQNDNPGYVIANASPLVYPGLSHDANYASGGGGYNIVGRDIILDSTSVTSGPYQPFVSDQYSEKRIDRGIVYLSFLLRRDSSSGNIEVALTNRGFFSTAPTNGDQFSLNIAGSNNGTYQLNYDTGADSSLYSAAINGAVSSIGTTHLFVVRIDFGTGDDATATQTIDVWADPTALGGVAPTPTTTVSFVGRDEGFRAISVYLGDSSGTASLDALRIGDSFASVTPVPEPTALAGVGLMGLLALRRRRMS